MVYMLTQLLYRERKVSFHISTKTHLLEFSTLPSTHLSHMVAFKHAGHWVCRIMIHEVRKQMKCILLNGRSLVYQWITCQSVIRKKQKHIARSINRIFIKYNLLSRWAEQFPCCFDQITIFQNPGSKSDEGSNISHLHIRCCIQRDWIT